MIEEVEKKRFEILKRRLKKVKLDIPYEISKINFCRAPNLYFLISDSLLRFFLKEERVFKRKIDGCLMEFAIRKKRGKYYLRIGAPEKENIKIIVENGKRKEISNYGEVEFKEDLWVWVVQDEKILNFFVIKFPSHRIR